MKLKGKDLCPGSNKQVDKAVINAYASGLYPRCPVCGGVVMLTKTGTIYNHRRRIMKSSGKKKQGRPIKAANLCPGSYSYISQPDENGVRITTASSYGQIISVTFRANVQLEPYQHAHVEATRTVGSSESPEEALAALKQFVAAELRLAKGEVQVKQVTIETPGRFRIPK